MTQSDIRVKIYCRLNLLITSVFNSECLDILRDSIAHPSKKLLSFEFAQSFGIIFERLDILRDSIRHPSKNLLSFEFAHSELRSSISSVSIYYRTPSDTRVKKLLPFEFAQTFNIQFQAFRYFTGLNRIAEQKVIVV